MSSPARRDFLKVAGAGVVAAGAVAVSTGSAEAKTTLPTGKTPEITALVSDVRSGKVLVMVEGHEITIVDHQLVAKLAHAAHAAQKVTLHAM